MAPKVLTPAAVRTLTAFVAYASVHQAPPPDRDVVLDVIAEESGEDVRQQCIGTLHALWRWDLLEVDYSVTARGLEIVASLTGSEQLAA
jgi:hypothetical protein